MEQARKWVDVCGLLLTLCLIGTSDIRGQSGTTVEGRVVDQSGAGVAPATVNLFSDDRVRTVETDNYGRFAFAGLTGSMHFLEASSRGFYTASVPVTNQITGPITIILRVGEGGQCPSYDLFTRPSAAYEQRSGKVQLIGTVADFSGLALPNASLNLMKADLNTPDAEWPDPHPNRAMNQRSFQYTFVMQMISNEKGEFQYSGLEPGWYSLKVGHEGYQEQTAKLWIARESLTRTTLIHLNLKEKATGCDTIFGPVYQLPLTSPSK